jgi:SAM-dependent methyltransferase
LGKTPLANTYAATAAEAIALPRYPLHVRVCECCFLVQADDAVPPDEIFSDYAYFSSYSDSWVEHARRFAHAAIERFALDASSLVVEVASNDGYLLRHFRDAGVRVLGVEPAANVAAVAVSAGIPTDVRFFGSATASALVDSGHQPDLLVANNVLAHVPDLNDFVAGLAIALKPSGVVSIECPHLLRLIEDVQFDTIYHEHYSYFSLLAAERVLGAHGLEVFDVEQLSTHGGSLRLLAQPAGAGRVVTPAVEAVRTAERTARLHELASYDGYAGRVEHCHRSLWSFLDEAAVAGDPVVAYGAAAKGNTLLNYAGVTSAEISFVVDRSPYKQGRFLPGSGLPIYDPEQLDQARPAYVLILPWNLRDELISQMTRVRSWGGRFVTAVPEVQVHA